MDEYNHYYFNFITNNLDKPWDWYCLSQNSNITFDIVLKNPDKPWDWHRLSGNPNITFDIVLKNPDKPWDWTWLSGNPNITFDIILQNPDKPWDWHWLSGNKMSLQKNLWLQKLLAIQKIENWWLEKMYSPNSNYILRVIKPHFENLLR